MNKKTITSQKGLSKSQIDKKVDFEVSTSGLYMVNPNNRNVLYSSETAPAPKPEAFYDKYNVQLEGDGDVIMWIPRVRLLTKAEDGDRAKKHLIEAAYQLAFRNLPFIIFANDGEKFAKFLQAIMVSQNMLGVYESDPSIVRVGTMLKHTYAKNALGVHGEEGADCEYHAVTAVAVDETEFIALEAHAGIKTLKRPTFHIRKSKVAFMADNDAVRDYLGKPTGKSRGLGTDLDTRHLPNDKSARQTLLDTATGFCAFGDEKSVFENLEDMISGLLIIATTEANQYIANFLEHILAQTKWWKNEAKMTNIPDGVSLMAKQKTLADRLETAIKKAKSSNSGRSKVTQYFYDTLVQLRGLLEIREQIDNCDLALDPNTLLSLYSQMASLSNFFGNVKGTITDSKKQLAESQYNKKLNSTSGLGKSCLIYAIFAAAGIDNKVHNHCDMARAIRQELIAARLATQYCFLVNDQAVLNVIFSYLRRNNIYTNRVNIHFISVVGAQNQVQDDNLTWNDGNAASFYIFNDSNIHFSAML